MQTVAPAQQGNPATINQVLVVEDEVLIRMLLADELRDAGFEVLEATNAKEAQRLLTSYDNIGVLVTDIQLPGSMNGLELARWARQQSPHMRIAIVSANAELAEEVDIAIAKPFDTNVVIAEVRRLLSKEERDR